ncbi:hypothetical protein BCIN_07g02250 [Botrytis cinerea B05.10]|uniref:Fungal N-terminal domain-containing protein n=1 Tax=Botryotinia fuckeliana (strain B05.10) TaxID=332648 RepID=A0A384JM87_BOTFB|nr:hypothetical protein BCIN_07g02250 [Botrytis cinerea B05.10]ATZ51620.1 hypothetical protein BCIN_07g02250 [Botrytis cinerea B05.10]
MPDPITVSAAASVASALSNSIAIASFVKDIKNTPADVKTCFSLTERVSTDLDHLILLRAQHHKYLSRSPFASKRLDGIVNDVRESILDICRLLEGCRKEVYEGGHIPVKKRLQWVLGDGAAFERRRGNLQQQHTALLAEIGWLRGLEVGKGTENLEFENVDLLSAGRRERKSSTVSRTGKQYEDIEVRQPNKGVEVDVEELDFGGDVEPDSPVTKEKIVRKPVAMPIESRQEVSKYEESDDEDPELAFYRDLRRQEEERRKRMAGRKKLRNP